MEKRFGNNRKTLITILLVRNKQTSARDDMRAEFEVLRTFLANDDFLLLAVSN